MESSEAAKVIKRAKYLHIKFCALFQVTYSTVIPVARLMLVQPFPNDGGHVHHVG